jgi:hypothetical protein
MRYIVGRVALIRRYRATFSQWEKAPSTVFKIYLGQLWSVTARFSGQTEMLNRCDPKNGRS